MRKKADAAARVNHVDVAPLLDGRDGLAVTVGIDVGQYDLLAVARWADGRFDRPWRATNPGEIGALVARRRRLGAGRELLVALEPSGTYGDALRPALAAGGLAVRRVGTKAAHDYAEVFDGVPSQHDGKDAAVVAELAALGKGSPWPYPPATAWQQELAYWVAWMVGQRQVLALWQGRLEGLLARHWPEATRALKLSSGTLLRVLARYGGPQALAADPRAAARLARWGGKLPGADKVAALLAGARSSAGVRPGEWQRRQLQDYARQALAARRPAARGQRRLCASARGHAVLAAPGRAVGLPTACVLWVSTGDPRDYPAAAAYRKALGLNLVERSSGTCPGPLHRSKRGSARSRQWLYFAARRLVQRAGGRGWYEAHKARQPAAAKRGLVALMRQLALALYHVGVTGQEFDPRRLFAGVVSPAPAAGARAEA